MLTILYQGKPSDGDHWLVLPDGFVPTYKTLGYATRELVLRDDAEAAKNEHFNAALEQAAAVIRAELGVVEGAALVTKVLAKKLPVKVEVSA
jgi:hypothetical protein